MKYEDMVLEKENGVALLTLNRPDKLNALTVKQREDFPKVMDEVQNDDDIRVLIITGAGRGFCAGFDFSQPVGRPDEKAKKSRRTIIAPVGGSWISLLARLEKPTIAAVNGVAAGGGLALALICDIRIAAQSARFTAAWVKRGLIPDIATTYFLPRIIGLEKALELMYTGDIISAKEAEQIGLVRRVVPDDELMKVAKELATKIANGPPIAIELIKRGVYQDILSGLGARLSFESYAVNLCYQSEDFKEGVASFLEKRPPQFKGQ